MQQPTVPTCSDAAVLANRVNSPRPASGAQPENSADAVPARRPRRRSGPALDRRQFVSGSLAASVAALGGGVQGNLGRVLAADSPNERLNLVSCGSSARAAANLAGCRSQNIIAIADVDSDLLSDALRLYKSAKPYKDFRVMLETEADKIDGVLVSTPDHTHAPAAAMALRMGKPTYCEKPLAHTVFETRLLSNLAKEKNVATQMGTQIHAGDNYRRVVELIQAGAIGPVTEAHAWAPADYSGGRFVPGKMVPENLDWDLWLGPAQPRPYSEGVHPFHWRRFWDYGTGGMGDFGCHYMDLVHWALNLRAPTRIRAEGPELDPISPPPWSIVHYDYPARGEQPPVKFTWYSGRRRPELLDSLRHADGQPVQWPAGQLFVGRDGMILSNYSHHLLLPEERFADYQRPEPTIPASVGHHQEWFDAIRRGTPTTCNFDYSGALTEAVVLGVVAYKSGQTLEWDSENFQITNLPDSQHLLSKEYRKGWELV